VIKLVIRNPRKKERKKERMEGESLQENFCWMILPSGSWKVLEQRLRARLE